MANKHFYIQLDTETAGTIEKPLVYDLGGAVIDRFGNVHETFNFVIYDIYVEQKEIMQSAYYAEKLPQYEIELKNGTRKLVRFWTAFKYIRELFKKYNIKAVIAHNAPFDIRALNNTFSFINGKTSFFLPYGTPIWCTLSMARQTFGKEKRYFNFCVENGYCWKDKYGNIKPRLTAEILYRFISKDLEFKEAHTGLEDVKIETVIFVTILNKHKKLNRCCCKTKAA